MILHRRAFLGSSGAMMLLGGCEAGDATQTMPQRQIEQVGIQTYTLREALAEDFIGTLQMVRDVGYDYVELNGLNLTDRTPAELRRILDDIGLSSPIMHVDYDSLANQPETLADVAATLGCSNVVLPWINSDQRSADQYRLHADMLNSAGSVLKASNIRVGYHNHQFEFFNLDSGQNGMQILLSNTDPDLVDFELDLFWAALTGTDLPGLFAQHPGRFKMCHIKDLSGDPTPWQNSLDFGSIVSQLMANVGEGDLPFETYFAANDISGMKYFIAEHDNPPRPFRDSIATSLTAIRAMRF